MNIPGVHIERIRGLGYTESEARFLYIVAVFSGYFTLGQFRAFTGASYGKRPASFAEKLIEQGHARICGQARRGFLFHLFSRTVYGQMEKDNLRNRKRHSLGFMRTRLVLLDFVLVNLDLAYFETEQETVNFFCQELGISKEYLPATVYESTAPDQKTIRYFVDKFPLFVAPPFSGLPPVVTFSYVDAGLARPSGFASHLAAYQPLFRELSRFRFLYIAAQEAHFHGVRQRFQSIVRRPLEPDLSTEILRSWVFASSRTGRPPHPWTAERRWLLRAGRKVGIERLGWHAFRHTYSSLLNEYGTDVKVQQELLRHADIRTTLNIYTTAVPERLRKANRKVVRLLLPTGT